MIKEDKCYDSNEYVKLVTGKYPKHKLTLKELEKMKLEEWNYPLTEITEVLENKIDVVLVRFPMSHNCSEYEYRFCEVNN